MSFSSGIQQWRCSPERQPDKPNPYHGARPQQFLPSKQLKHHKPGRELDLSIKRMQGQHATTVLARRLTAHLLSVHHMTVLTMATFFLLIVVRMSSTLVCSLIHDALFPYLHVMLSIILSISLWAHWKVLFQSFHKARSFVLTTALLCRFFQFLWLFTFFFTVFFKIIHCSCYLFSLTFLFIVCQSIREGRPSLMAKSFAIVIVRIGRILPEGLWLGKTWKVPRLYKWLCFELHPNYWEVKVRPPHKPHIRSLSDSGYRHNRSEEGYACPHPTWPLQGTSLNLIFWGMRSPGSVCDGPRLNGGRPLLSQKTYAL